MAQTKWTEPVLNILNEIAEYMVLEKPAVAKKWVKIFFKTVGDLKISPSQVRNDPNYPKVTIEKSSLGPAEYSIELKVRRY